MEQSTMMKEISKCCQKNPLSLSDLERHMTAFFAAVLGVSSTDGHPVSMENLKENLNHYFVNKKEFQAMSGQIHKGTLSGIWKKICSGKMTSLISGSSNLVL